MCVCTCACVGDLSCCCKREIEGNRQGIHYYNNTYIYSHIPAVCNVLAAVPLASTSDLRVAGGGYVR